MSLLWHGWFRVARSNTFSVVSCEINSMIAEENIIIF